MQKTVYCFTSYPSYAPSVYHRVKDFRTYWEDDGYSLQVYSLFSERLYESRKSGGLLAQMLKVMSLLINTLRILWLVFRLPANALVIIHREVFPLGTPWLERWIASRAGYCFYDLDDAIWSPPSGGPDQRAVWSDSMRVAKIMSAVDCVVAGNDYIADYARRYAQNITVIPTSYVDMHATAQTPKSAAKAHAQTLAASLPAAVHASAPIVVWIGNLGNAKYLEPLIAPLRRVSQQTPFTLRLIGGVDLYDIDFGDLPVEIVMWSREVEAQALSSSDIGIMPLFNLAYEKGKCAFKLIQYMSFGMPVVASDVGVNSQVIIEGITGFLARNDSQWEAALVKLIGSPEVRRDFGIKGYQRFVDHYSRQKCANLWVQAFENANI